MIIAREVPENKSTAENVFFGVRNVVGMVVPSSHFTFPRLSASLTRYFASAWGTAVLPAGLRQWNTVIERSRDHARFRVLVPLSPARCALLLLIFPYILVLPLPSRPSLPPSLPLLLSCPFAKKASPSPSHRATSLSLSLLSLFSLFAAAETMSSSPYAHAATRNARRRAALDVELFEHGTHALVQARESRPKDTNRT